MAISSIDKDLPSDPALRRVLGFRARLEIGRRAPLQREVEFRPSRRFGKPDRRRGAVYEPHARSGRSCFFHLDRFGVRRFLDRSARQPGGCLLCPSRPLRRQDRAGDPCDPCSGGSLRGFPRLDRLELRLGLVGQAAVSLPHLLDDVDAGADSKVHGRRVAVWHGRIHVEPGPLVQGAPNRLW